MQVFSDTPSFGASMGSSIGEALSQLGSYKANQIIQRHEKKREREEFKNALLKMNIPGMTNEMAEGVAMMPQPFQQNFFADKQNFISEAMRQNMLKAEEKSALGKVLGSGGAGQPPQQPGQPLPNLTPPANQQPGYQPLTPQNTQPQNLNAAIPGAAPQMASMRKPVEPAAPPLGIVPPSPILFPEHYKQQSSQRERPLPLGKSEQNAMIRTGIEEAKERRHQEKMAFEKEKEQRKATSKQEEEFDKTVTSAEKQEETINEMLAFLPKARVGDLQNVMEKLHIGELGRNVPTQIVHAKIKELTQGAKAAYDASRLSNLEVDLFSESLENARNTRAGIEAIAKTQLRKINVLKYKTGIKMDLKEKNNGVLPYDWKDQVRIQSKPYSDYQWKETMNDLRRYSGK